MKEKVKFLWIYTGILFSFALILIIFAGLAENNMSEEKEGYQSRIEALTKQNEELRNENNLLKQSEAALNEELSKLNEKEEINEIIEQALEKLENDKKDEAKSIVKDVDKSKASDLQKYVIDKINE